MVNKNKKLHIFLILVISCSSLSIFGQEFSAVNLYNSSNKILQEGIEKGNVDLIHEAVRLLHKGLEINQNYYEILYKLTIGYFVLGEMSQAKEYLDRATKLHTNNPILYGIDIFIALKSQDITRSFDLILVAKQKFPNNPYLYYLELVYYSFIGDERNIAKLVDLFSKKYGDHIYLKIYSTARAIVEQHKSYEIDIGINRLTEEHPKNIWINWLLTNYYLIVGIDTDINDRLRTLENSKIDFLSTFAFEEQILLAYNRKNYELAKNIAQKYSDVFPDNYKSWYYLGMAYYKQGNLRYSERAFNRAISLVPRNDVIQFIHDTILKEGGVQLSNLSNKRVLDLHILGTKALNKGNITQALNYFYRLLYIDPLDMLVRRKLVDIFGQQGNYYKAIENLLLLQKYEYAEEDINFLLKHFREKIKIESDNQGNFISNELSDVSQKIWDIELGNIIQNFPSNNTVAIDFQRKLFEYYLSRSSEINWTSSLTPNNAGYTLDIIFYSYENIIICRPELKVKNTDKLIKTFDRFVINNRYSLKIYKEISDTLDKMMPSVVYIDTYNKVDKTVSLHTSSANIFNIGDIYSLYSNDNLNIMLKASPPYFFSETPEIGKIKIDELSGSYFTASILKRDGTQEREGFEYYKLLNTVVISDFIIVPPDWTTLTTNTDKVIKSHKLYKQQLLNYYLLNILFIMPM